MSEYAQQLGQLYVDALHAMKINVKFPSIEKLVGESIRHDRKFFRIDGKTEVYFFNRFNALNGHKTYMHVSSWRSSAESFLRKPRPYFAHDDTSEFKFSGKGRDRGGNPTEAINWEPDDRSLKDKMRTAEKAIARIMQKKGLDFEVDQSYSYSQIGVPYSRFDDESAGFIS